MTLSSPPLKQHRQNLPFIVPKPIPFPMAITPKPPSSGKALLILSMAALALCILTFILFPASLSSIPTSKIKTKDSKENNDSSGFQSEDRLKFNQGEYSNSSDGRWVFNDSITALYSDRTCPYLERQFTCIHNGRMDFDYLRWEWRSDYCILPRFDPKVALEKLQGKRMMFVGDSIQKSQWQSFVCMVEWMIPERQKSMQQGKIHKVFKAKEYNATIEFYWAPFLVESNSDVQVKDLSKRIVKVDSVWKHAKNWIGLDILVFNTYVWWKSGAKMKSLWGSFANGEDGFEELETAIAYRLGLKTWGNWIDSTIDPNKTRVFFTTMSPTHMRSEDWKHKDGIKCYNETKPIMKKGHWGSGSDREIMSVVANIVQKMKTDVTVINITQMSEYRVDGHTSIYTEMEGHLLNEEQKADPRRYADCIHWCLPGVPDTWNRLLFAHL